MRTYDFQTTIEQKALIQKLVEAIKACRKADIQFFTTDGANELLCYNSTDFDQGPDTGDNLSGEWQEGTDHLGYPCKRWVLTDKAELAGWMEIPIADCDIIDGEALGVDFVSWGCCNDGFFAHKKQV